MSAMLAALIAFGVVQFFWSVRFAYRCQRHELAAGYPIFGHAACTFLVLLMMVVLLPKNPVGSRAIRGFAVSVLVGLPVLHGWLLYTFDRLGEKRRTAAARKE